MIGSLHKKFLISSNAFNSSTPKQNSEHVFFFFNKLYNGLAFNAKFGIKRRNYEANPKKLRTDFELLGTGNFRTASTFSTLGLIILSVII